MQLWGKFFTRLNSIEKQLIIIKIVSFGILSADVRKVMAEERSIFFKEHCLIITASMSELSLFILFNYQVVMLCDYNNLPSAVNIIVNFGSIFDCFTVYGSTQILLTEIVFCSKLFEFGSLMEIFIKYQTNQFQMFINLFDLFYSTFFNYVQNDSVDLVVSEYLEREKRV